MSWDHTLIKAFLVKGKVLTFKRLFYLWGKSETLICITDKNDPF